MSMPGEVRISHTGGKCVTCCELSPTVVVSISVPPLLCCGRGQRPERVLRPSSVAAEGSGQSGFSVPPLWRQRAAARAGSPSLLCGGRGQRPERVLDLVRGVRFGTDNGYDSNVVPYSLNRLMLVFEWMKARDITCVPPLTAGSEAVACIDWNRPRY